MSETMKNLESAFAGESQAYTKYMYFAQIAREEGHEDIAKHFEHTASQEVKHAWGHLELLIGKPSTKECLQKAIDGEQFEYTEMYPEFERLAKYEGNMHAMREMQDQAAESRRHAEEFAALLDKAQRRFSALKRVEERHAQAYRDVLGKL